jgi:hypothetical protein
MHSSFFALNEAAKNDFMVSILLAYTSTPPPLFPGALFKYKRKAMRNSPCKPRCCSVNLNSSCLG